MYELDALRIVAALSVMLYHYTFSGPAGGLSSIAFPRIGQVTRYGYLGVDAFFVVSGFVVLLSAWNRTPRRFLVSRASRVYPAYWAAVTFTAIVCVVLGSGRFPVSGAQYLANLTMFNAPLGVENVDVVYWTLWAELRFYGVVLALILVGLTRRRVTVALWLWLGTSCLTGSGYLPASLSRLLDVPVQSSWAHYFVAGMALCLVTKYGPTRSSVLLVLASYALALHHAIGFADAVADRYGASPSPAVVIALVTAIFLVMAGITTGRTRRLARPWFAHLGALTYPLYLLHAYTGFVLFNRLRGGVEPHALLMAVSFTMCVAAYALHRVVETPLAGVLRRRLMPAARLKR
ncbi:acyltransferase [Streptomyces sp. ME03-5684b]|uniref:acyltransferase family protein n=1 Tax=Streptomyces sp. ME03-5684b TaxID=3028681 RepID=UPI0029A733FA|nr:acyltransferase [Streptomyces sp. ME03-5684b]MDX3322934.1 acyltransferase [Streptomyces sp. ME03-5684b]